MGQQLELFNGNSRPDRLTVSEAFDFLWKYHLGGKPSARTYMGNRKALCKSFGHRWLDGVTFVDVRAHKETRPRGAAFHDHGLVSLLHNKLGEWKRSKFKSSEFDFSLLRLPENSPTVGLKRGSTGTRSRVITPNEFSKLIELAPDFLRDIMVIRLDTGLRETDIRRLRPESLNPYNDEIEMTQSKTGKRISIPASARVKRIFRESAGKKLVCDFRGIEYWWKRVRRDAKLPGVQLRDLRRSGPSWAYEKFSDHSLMGEWLGHADPRSTRRYVVIRRERLRQVVRHVEREYAK